MKHYGLRPKKRHVRSKWGGKCSHQDGIAFKKAQRTRAKRETKRETEQ